MVLVEPYPFALDLMMESHFEDDTGSGAFLGAESYDTDEFRMYFFKVLPCSKRYSHDWTTCPFAHPGEKARRRDPRMCQYTAIACPEMKKDMACPRGRSCPYSHNDFEYWLHPSRYRTQLCNDGLNCRRKVCFFAHQPLELRVPACKPALPDSSADAAKFAVPPQISTERTSLDSVSSTGMPSSSQLLNTMPVANWVLAPGASPRDPLLADINDVLLHEQRFANPATHSVPVLQQQLSGSLDHFANQLASLSIASQPDQQHILPVASSSPHMIHQHSPVSMHGAATSPTVPSPQPVPAALFPQLQQSSLATRMAFRSASNIPQNRRNSITLPLTIPEHGPLNKAQDYTSTAANLAYQSSLYAPAQINAPKLDNPSPVPPLHQQLNSLNSTQQRRSLDSTTQLLAQQQHMLAQHGQGLYSPFSRRSFDVHQLRAIQDSIQTHPADALLQQQLLHNATSATSLSRDSFDGHTSLSRDSFDGHTSLSRDSFEAQSQQHQQQQGLPQLAAGDALLAVQAGTQHAQLQPQGSGMFAVHPTQLSGSSNVDMYQLLSNIHQ